MAKTIANTCTTKAYRQIKHALSGRKGIEPGKKSKMKKFLSPSMRKWMKEADYDPEQED